MAEVEFSTSARWNIGAEPVGRIAVQLDTLIARFAVPVVTYWQDGLGPARALFGRVHPETLFALEELEHDAKHGTPVSYLYIDLLDIAARGLGPVVDDILAALGLSRADVVSLMGKEFEEQMAKRVAEIACILPRPTTAPRD